FQPPRIPRCIRSSQAARLGLDQSDQRTAMVVKVATVLRPRIASGPISISLDPSSEVRTLDLFRLWLRFASRWTLNRTSPPRMPQNNASGSENPQIPRSQNDWYACSSHVARKTVTVATARADGWGHRLSRNTTGLNTSRTMKSFQ